MRMSKVFWDAIRYSWAPSGNLAKDRESEPRGPVGRCLQCCYDIFTYSEEA